MTVECTCSLFRRVHAKVRRSSLEIRQGPQEKPTENTSARYGACRHGAKEFHWADGDKFGAQFIHLKELRLNPKTANPDPSSRGCRAPRPLLTCFQQLTRGRSQQLASFHALHFRSTSSQYYRSHVSLTEAPKRPENRMLVKPTSTKPIGSVAHHFEQCQPTSSLDI